MKKYPAASDFVGSPIQTAWYPIDSVLVRQASLPRGHVNTTHLLLFVFVTFDLPSHPENLFKHETDPQFGEASKVWKMRKMKRL